MDKDKSTWQEIIKGLPAYKTVNDEPCYYKYSVTETEVNDYETDVKHRMMDLLQPLQTVIFPSFQILVDGDNIYFI